MQKSTRGSLIGLGFLAACGAGLAYWAMQSVLTSDERAVYGEQCREFIQREFAKGGKAEVRDSWKKNGRPVFLVYVTEPGKTSMQAWPCVVDERTMTLSKPSAFDRSWQR